MKLLSWPNRAFALVLFTFFLSSISFSQTTVTVSVLTDCWGGESYWSLYDAADAQLANVGSGTLGNLTVYTQDVVLADGCYNFVMGDTYGDGLNGASWGGCGVDGDYSVTDEFGNVLVQMSTAAFGTSASHFFTLPFGADAGCTDPAANNFNECAVTDDGSCTYPPLLAEFSYTATAFCAGTDVQFTDESIGNPNSWAWTFSGGNPATSTDQNPLVNYPTSGTFSASLTVENANAESSTIAYDVVITEGHTLEIVIIQDNYPGETSWNLVDEFGATVANGGVNSAVLCIEDNCHVFTINDTYGDGICCGYGNGSYALILDGVEIATGGQFAYTESINLNCPPGIDCNNTITAVIGQQTAPYPNAWYSFVPDTSGQWEITTCGLATCDTEIWIYDYCNMANFDDSNEATLTWNDDQCGVQAGVTPLMEEGLTYYIRIGDQGACGSDPIDFAINFLGGVSGCMDPEGCNYLPIAVEPATCYFPGDVQCPLFGPDLEVLGDVFFNSMYSVVLNNNDACYINEGCMQGFGDREIIRFTTHIKNIGTEDYFIGDPNDQPDQFEFDQCHGHWHYEGYAEYLLFDDQGTQMPEIGFKNGFCVLDLECSDGGQGKYTCGNMGISYGCGDIYSSGLSCQWIDVTGVPAGTYTMMIRTNWDQSPDANGSYELSYDNNWATVCISFDRDVDGNLINFTKTLDCGLLFDCLGVPNGNAQPDCMGNCPGLVATGDLDNTGDLANPDVDQYVSDILGNDGWATPCTDLNSDGDINVTDAVVAAGCIFYGPDHVDEQGVHDHCIWENEIINPNHLVTLSIGEVNQELGYVDVHILNPDCEIIAYQFQVSGITISSVENLIDPLEYDITPAASLGGSMVVGLSYDGQLVPKNYTPAPLVRIYYFDITDPNVCVSVIDDIVNFNFHNTMTAIGPCLPIDNADFAEFTSTATAICAGESIDFQDLSTNGAIAWSWNFPGGNPSSSTDQHPAGIVYANPGTYNVTLTVTNGSDFDSETKGAFVTVQTSTTYYADNDNDGYGDGLSPASACVQPAGHVLDNSDCDDTNPDIYPGAPGTHENIDNDCNGIVEGEELASCPGDFNGDNQVNVTDLLEFLADYGCLADCGDSDMDGSGIVDTADLLLFLGVYGTVCN